MALTYAQARMALDEITARIAANRKRLANASDEIAAAEADLASMPAAYAATGGEIDAAAAAAPEDAAWGPAKAQKDKLVAEFLGLKDEATGMKNALAAL